MTILDPPSWERPKKEEEEKEIGEEVTMAGGTDGQTRKERATQPVDHGRKAEMNNSKSAMMSRLRWCFLALV